MEAAEAAEDMDSAAIPERTMTAERNDEMIVFILPSDIKECVQVTARQSEHTQRKSTTWRTE